MVIFYKATVHNLTGIGPMWNVINTLQTGNCEKYWWANLLYINNYYKPAETTVKNVAGFPLS
jgi:hypothetical protein